MCGISGIIDFNFKLSKEKLQNIILEFNNTLKHRGPDNAGSWMYNNIGMGHTRLSIIDLSNKGNQPMLSNNEKSIISYNGEIYNFKELSQMLKNIKLKSNTDTEVILEFYTQFGIDSLIHKANGMYAFSIFDKKKNCLLLARDKVGKKPLYYFYDEDYFIWGSELNIFKIDLLKNKLNISKEALQNYFEVGYVPSPLSIFTQIKKLLPGEVISLDINSKKIFTKKNSFIKNNSILVNNSFEDTIIDSVNIRTMSDVPYGVFLSSGVDSTLVAAILKSLKPSVQSFSIGLKNNKLDESKDSRKIAKALNLNHHEEIIDETNLMGLFDQISKTYGEPFADSSQIPTMLLSSFSKKKITVALSGDGGDEIFCGYNRYLYTYRYQKIINLLFIFNKTLGKLPYNITKKIAKFFFKNFKILDKINSLDDIKNYNDLYKRLVKQYSNDLTIFKESKNYHSLYTKNDHKDFKDPLVLMQSLDIQNYLPDDILTKVDRASMRSSLEVRCPLLDIRLSSAIFLSEEEKINNKKSKIILRDILKKYIDPKIISIEKKGFAIPINDWLLNGLKKIANDLILSDTLKDDQYIDYKKIRIIWDDHLKKKQDYSQLIWSLLIYLQWKINWKVS
jgi:asparagine synthase (glutamine-hydrolysing)